MNIHDHLEPPPISSLGVNIYMDESGDLGYPNGSEFFVFGAIIVKSSHDEICCKKAVTRAKKKISNDYSYDELKSSKLREKCRETVIKEILKGSYDFGYCLLRKNDVREERRNTASLYNWLAPKLVEDIIMRYGFKADVNLIIDGYSPILATKSRVPTA
jgi:hypothetical protein